MEFAYANLDIHHSESIFRPIASNRDLNFRDERYANIITKAYREGKNIIVILGALHVFPDPDESNTYAYKCFGPRELMSDRLRVRGIPSICLYPFNRSHTPAVEECKNFENNTFTSSSTDSSQGYSVDIKDEQGVRNFLEAIDVLSSALEKNQDNQISKNDQTKSSRIS